MPNKKQTGGTLLELAVASIIIAVLAVLLLNRMQRYQEAAEKTVMETTVVNMRSGLRWRVAELMVQGRMDEMGRLSRESPVLWLEAPPSNYVGPVDNPEQQAIPPGSWYFDTTRRELVYLPDRSKYFRPGPDGEKAVRYRVTATAGQRNGQVEGINISLVRPYDWPVF